jgi:hypothetical protein
MIKELILMMSKVQILSIESLSTIVPELELMDFRVDGLKRAQQVPKKESSLI